VKSPNARITGQRYTLDNRTGLGRVRIEEFESINGKAAQDYLAALPNLQLGLSLAAPILKPGTFEIPTLGTINLHKGKLPDYRGMPPAFWEIRAGESEVGVSVHYVEKGLDTGPLVKSGSVPIERFSSPAGLLVALDEMGHDLVCKATIDILAGDRESKPQEEGGRTNSRPKLKVEWETARSIARKEGTYGAVQRLKNTVFNSYSAAREVGAWTGIVKPTITVLLYHRVSDAFRDSVTIGVERFDKHLEYLKNNYEVRSLRSLVNGDMPKEDDRTIVCITFDDGYLDNYTNAAPLLLKHGLPATFFVSTDNVTNQTPFQHDLDELGFGLPNMTWDNIREMDQDGFDFGSHSTNHADLGRIPEEQIIDELVISKKAIEDELNHDNVLFAFPFGKKHNFSERARDIVKDVGYICCCAAFGGQNSANQWDPFRINRMGINYNFSIPALRARIHGWPDA
jgi:peptidoglycan/xylan/chitin deacetylase (PgdA/CDA1 family)